MPVIETRPSRRTLLAAGLVGGVAATVQAMSVRSQNRSLPMETTIRPDGKIVTLINVFTVEPENQQKLLALLKEGTETLMAKMTGWISTNFLASKDARRVVIYSQWQSAEDIEAMRQVPQMGPYFQRVAALAKMEAIACDVVHVLHV